MMAPMHPTDRYVVLRQGVPVFTTNDVDGLIAYLWGRNIKDNYVVLDYEMPYPVDNPNLTAWIAPLHQAAHAARLRRR